jgi:hypothetical protein
MNAEQIIAACTCDRLIFSAVAVRDPECPVHGDDLDPLVRAEVEQVTDESRGAT